MGFNCPSIVLQGEMFKFKCLEGKNPGGKYPGKNLMHVIVWRIVVLRDIIQG